MRKAPIILAVLVAVALLAIACKDRIDKGVVERADAATQNSLGIHRVLILHQHDPMILIALMM